MTMERERRSLAQTEHPQDGRPAEKAPNQPSRETLPSSGSVERPTGGFTGADDGPHHDEQSVAQAAEHEGPQNADGPSVESTMGRHESFKHGILVDAALLESTSINRLAHADPLVELGIQFDSFRGQWDAYFAGPEDPDGEAQNAEEERLAALSIPLMRQMANQRAQSAAGLDAKLRVIQHCFNTDEDVSDELENAETEDLRMMYSIMRDLMEWRGTAPYQSLVWALGRKTHPPGPPNTDTEADALVALAPVLLPLIDECEACRVRLRELHAAGEREAGDQPQGVGITDASIAWDKRCEEAWSANGYKAGCVEVAAIERRIEALADPFLEQPATTLEGIALKMRLAAVFPYFEEAAKADLLRVQILPSQAAGERS